MTEFGKNSNLTEAEINIIVVKAVRAALETLGIDLHDTKAVRELQADFLYMRQQRVGSEKIAEWIKKSVITSAFAGALYALWQGLRLALSVKTGMP